MLWAHAERCQNPVLIDPLNPRYVSMRMRLLLSILLCLLWESWQKSLNAYVFRILDENRAFQSLLFNLGEVWSAKS